MSSSKMSSFTACAKLTMQSTFEVEIDFFWQNLFYSLLFHSILQYFEINYETLDTYMLLLMSTKSAAIFLEIDLCHAFRVNRKPDISTL